MPAWPAKPGRRHLTIDFPVDQVAHLDRQAELIGLTRAGYLRLLVDADIRKQGKTKAQAASKAE
jgi:hypothetical protein